MAHNYIQHRSPNLWTPEHAFAFSGIWWNPWGILYHDTEGSFPSDRDYLCDEHATSRVSAHVYIHRDGTPELLVPFQFIAWHCWVRPEWRTARYNQLLLPYPQKDKLDSGEHDHNGNLHWLGIEMSGLRGQGHTPQQEATLIAVTMDMMAQYPHIKPTRACLFTHSEMNKEKVDPSHWNWEDYLPKLQAALAGPKK